MSAYNFSTNPVEVLSNDLDRLTILRYVLEMSPISNLLTLMGDLLSEDTMPYDIQWAYHDLSGAILCTDTPRITGDHWRDFILHILLDRPNAFSLSAMKGHSDETLSASMANDLIILQRLFLLDDTVVRNWCSLRQPLLDTGRWTSFTCHDFYIVEGGGPVPSMRRMLLASEDWSALTAPLYELHAACGAGVPLAHQWMTYDGVLAPIRFPNLSPGDNPNPALGKALENFAAAGRSKEIPAVLLTGGDALEKARQALLHTGVKIICLQDTGQFDSLAEQIRSLRLRFAVVVPLAHPSDPALVNILGEGFCLPPENILPMVLFGPEDAALASRFALVI